MASRLISLTVNTDGAEDYFQTFQKLSEIAIDLDKAGDFRYINVSAVRNDEIDDDEPELVYTEFTLKRVHDAIKNAVPYIDEQGATDIISEMQNAGILFREAR